METSKLQPTKIRKPDPTELAISWSDNHESRITLKTLRDACPCAGCKGETVLFRTYVPPEADVRTPGRYDLNDALAVGNYALKLTWGDGHDMGMYPWDLLRSLCECEQCRAINHRP